MQLDNKILRNTIETGERALKAVKEVLVRENDELLRIETGSGDVDATTSHPFYVVGRGWVAAGDLSVGDAIRALSGDVRTVTALRLEKLESPIPVYNLDVEDFHSYFVGSGVLVHNRCKRDQKQFRDAARQGKIDRKRFSNALHQEKDQEGRGGADHLTWKQLKKLIDEIDGYY